MAKAVSIPMACDMSCFHIPVCSDTKADSRIPLGPFPCASSPTLADWASFSGEQYTANMQQVPTLGPLLQIAVQEGLSSVHTKKARLPV